MPAAPRRLKELVEDTVDHHASLTHPSMRLREITIRWKGSSGYMDTWAGDGDDNDNDNDNDNDERIPLCRIEYPGDDDWALALYDPATQTYEDTIFGNGQYTSTPSDAYDTAAIVHLTEYEHEQ